MASPTLDTPPQLDTDILISMLTLDISDVRQSDLPLWALFLTAGTHGTPLLKIILN